MQLRTRALARHRLPEELDNLVEMAPLRAWLGLAAVGAAVVILVTWSFAGNLPRELSAGGVLTSRAGVSNVQSDQAGQVSQVLIGQGSDVKAGQVVAKLKGPAGGSEQDVKAPLDGQVVSMAITAGQVLKKGDPVYTLRRAGEGADTIDALVFLPPDKGASIRAGMKADLDVSSAPSSAFGVVHGEVMSVSTYPSSREALTALVGSEDLARQYSQDGPPVVARVRLKADKGTRSGFDWSTPDGPPFQLKAGTTLTGRITQEDQKPIDVLFGT